MAGNLNSSKAFKVVLILTLGVILAFGGIFLWKNDFNLSFLSHAGTSKTSHIVVLGDYTKRKQTHFTLETHSTLEKELGRTLSYVNVLGDEVTLPLKDQTVTAYQKLPQPISGKVAFIVLSGQETVRRGLKNGNSPHAIAAKFENDLQNMLSLASDRPGVFPDGITLYVSDFYDVTDGLYNTPSCIKKYPYESSAQLTTLKAEMNKVTSKFAEDNIGKVSIVPLSEAVVGHAAGSASTSIKWFNNCDELNDLGKEEFSNLFVKKIAASK